MVLPCWEYKTACAYGKAELGMLEASSPLRETTKGGHGASNLERACRTQALCIQRVLLKLTPLGFTRTSLFL